MALFRDEDPMDPPEKRARASEAGPTTPSVGGRDAEKCDQFFTKPEIAERCVRALENTLGQRTRDIDTVLEPSSGAGAFVAALRRRAWASRDLQYYDLDEEDPEHRADFFTLQVDTRNYERGYRVSILVVGNPPFGRGANLAIGFFNHAATFADVIAFIVPKTFRKDSVLAKLSGEFWLVADWSLPPNSFTLRGAPHNVITCFQIWRRRGYDLGPGHQATHLLRPPISLPPKTPDFEFSTTNKDFDIVLGSKGIGTAGRFYEGNPGTGNYFYIKFTPHKIGALPRAQAEQLLRSLPLREAPERVWVASMPSLAQVDVLRYYHRTRQHFLEHGSLPDPAAILTREPDLLPL